MCKVGSSCVGIDSDPSIAVVSLMDEIGSEKFAKDVSMRDFLVSKGINERGLSFADARYAQTCALGLDHVGMMATQREVRSFSLLFLISVAIV
jgi:hypothetical protein